MSSGALPETVTYGDTFTLTATGGGEGALTWAATGAASVDKDGTVTITGAGSFTITATKGARRLPPRAQQPRRP